MGKLALFLTRQKHLKNIGGILSANVLNNMVSFLITIIAARSLGPQEFGRLGIAISITLLYSLLTDFGLNITLVRFYNLYSVPEEREEFYTSVLGWKLLLLFLAVPGAYLLQLGTLAFLPILEGHEMLVYFSYLSGALLSLWSTILAIEQARRNFRVYAGTTLAYGFFRLLTAAALVLIGGFTALGVLAALYVIPLTILIFYVCTSRYIKLLNKIRLSSLRSKLLQMKNAFSYSMWVALTSISYNLLSRIPQFYLGYSGKEEQVGLYSAGLTFVAVFSLFNEATRTVLLPDVAALQTEEGRLQFRRRLLKATPFLFAAGLFAITAMALLQVYVLGEAYRASVHVFLLLGGATMVVMYFGLYNMLVHSYGVPRMEAAVNSSRLIALLLLVLLLPPTALYTGAAFAVVLVMGEITTFNLVKKISKKRAVSKSFCEFDTEGDAKCTVESR